MSLLNALRKTVFLGWLIGGLVAMSLALGLWAFHLTATVATMSANAASMALRHRKEMARALTKAKAKARLRRMLVAVPVVGFATATVFEINDYNQWQEENPDKKFNDYVCEMRDLTAEVMDEVLQELPERIRPSPDSVMEGLPSCSENDVAAI